MIFVTVGTHEQPFNRLVEYIDHLKRDGLIDEEVVIQTGYSTYEPKYCIWQKLFSFQQMVKLVDEARIVITHGGPSSFIMPLRVGKIPIVVPRQKKFGEHINDHQVFFSQEVSNKMGTIIMVVDVKNLVETIKNYDDIISAMPVGISSNNAKFNMDLEGIVDELIAGRKKKK